MSDRWNGIELPEDEPEHAEPWSDPADDYRDSHPDEECAE